jgi:hypothetical protein
MRTITISRLRESYCSICRHVGTALQAPTKTQSQLLLFVVGFALLAGGLSQGAHAAINGLTTYNDSRIANSVNAVMTYLEGSFGALVMAAAGIGAIMSAAFGQYKTALSLMVVAVGAFILRSLMSTFFNDINVQANS